MSGLSETSMNIFNNFIKRREKTLIETPIRSLRQQLKEECVTSGCPDIKYMSSLLSRERRRIKKVIYSKDERKRNKQLLGKITADVRGMLLQAESLKMEKYALENDLIFYKTAVRRLLTERTIPCIENQTNQFWQDPNIHENRIY